MTNPDIIDEAQNRLMTDMGPVYHETDLDKLSQLVVEPFNAYSSLAMSFAAVLVWLVFLRKDYKNYPFLAFVFTPLIFVGGIGSTLFHASRSSQLFLLMDWLPILLLTVLLSLFYWYKIYPKRYFIVLLTLLILAARALPTLIFQGSAAINVSYFLSGVLILIPLLLFMVRNHFRYWKVILFSIITLCLALYFRFTDDIEQLVLPMGTHWLWHIFSAAGAWFLGEYIFKTSQNELTTTSQLDVAD